MKALVLFSGGIDSTTCLALAIDKYGKENVIALSISYGQKHLKEIEAAKNICEYYGVTQLSLDLGKIFKYSDCSLLTGSSKEIIHESYDKQLIESNGETATTYVPFRNGLFLSASASIALSKGCSEIYYGIHMDDAALNAYPDCSEEFNKSMADAIYIGCNKKLKIVAPFVDKNKAYIIKTGLSLNVPYELTWSCYEGKDKPCLTCGTCIDRMKAFEANGIKDPALNK